MDGMELQVLEECVIVDAQDLIQRLPLVSGTAGIEENYHSKVLGNIKVCVVAFWPKRFQRTSDSRLRVADLPQEVFVDVAFSLKDIQRSDHGPVLLVRGEELYVQVEPRSAMVNATLAPPEVAARFSYIEDDFRRDTVANIVLLDQAIGEIVKALDDAGMLENSIIVFSSDNGGNTGPMVFAGTGDSSNYPLKGTKASLFEGGTRVPGFIFSPLISARSRLSSKLTHMVDWFPTLYAAAGGNVSEILSQTELDSFDQWKWLAEGEGPVGDYGIREEMLYNIDENIPTAAIRIGKWKYITGPQMMNNVIWNVSLNGWFGDSGRLNLTTQEDLDAYNDVLEWTSQMNLAGQILSRKGWLPSGEIMEELRAYRTRDSSIRVL
ncbi:unnamed protein product [Cyprideis torosa]|uniref:Sulfatase N-terminal domain-containing protein n=1 Tax=Cyprideis torosa TaxID=163714 RepID=A0A7R8WCQ0_9CRUS|nr:unnamed protein product [Cyprideis torosa]CAG0893735.1 unnamed protein product [Cyprideis torosa]